MTTEIGALTGDASAAVQPDAEAWPPAGQAWYALFILSLSLMVNFLDRGILNLLVQPIKRDLHLSDTQMGFVMGFAFIVFYVILGLPVARLVDTRSRKLIMTCGIAVWAVMTTMCGFARSFGQLFACRVGVGVGEATSGPATYSILADYFPPERLPRALSVLQLGFVAGVGLSSLIGALVIELLSGSPTYTVPVLGTVFAWQLVFLIVGIPGLIVAVLMLTVKEPKRRGRLAQKSLPILDILRYLVANWRVYGPMFLGLAISSVPAGGAMWGATFFQRTYGWSPQHFGAISGIMLLVTTPFGLFAGGWLAEYFARHGRDDGNLRVVVLAAALGLPGSILMPLMPSPTLALALTFFNGIVLSMAAGPQNAALQVVTPNEFRGQVTALYLFIFNVVGYGIGPEFIPFFTDHVFHDENMLRYSMALSTFLLSPLALLVLWWGLKPYGLAVAQARARR